MNLGRLYIKVCLFIVAFANAQEKFVTDSIQIIPYLLRGEKIYTSNLDSSVIYWKKGLALTNSKMQANPSANNKYLNIKAVFLNDLGYSQLMFGKKEIAKRYFDTCMRIQMDLKLWEQYALALNNLANIYLNDGDYTKAIELFIQSIDTYKNNGIRKELPMVYSNIGMTYKKIGDYQKSIDYYFEAEKLADQYNKKYKPSLYANICDIYIEQKDTPNFLKYVQKAIIESIYHNNLSDLAYSYLKLGGIYAKSNKYLAQHYYLKSLGIRKKINDRNGVANTLYNMASLSKEDSSISKYKQAKDIYKEVGDKEGYYYCALMEGLALKRKKQMNEAEKIMLEVYREFDNMHSVNGIILTSNYLHELYLEKNEPGKAIAYYKKHVALKDSISSFDIRKKTLQKNLANEFEKRTEQLEKDHLVKEKILEKDKERQRMVSYGILVILLVVFVFSVLLYRNLQEKKKANQIILEQKEEVQHQKEIIEEKQKEIVDSINYAQQIQKTLLANHDLVNAFLPDSFVFFQPRDIVSGDFYWATKKDDLFYLAVCDSTGHGVPGAFMSLLNISFLNEAINEKEILDPSAVFNFVRKRLIDNISQYGRQDGMDGILLCYHTKTKQLSYSSANCKAFRIRERECLQLPFDKMPVGKGTRNEEFNTYSAEIASGDMLYLFTDGFADQFGGPKGKKFKVRHLESTLMDLSHSSTSDQLEQLKVIFSNWQGKHEQVDDVCVLGIRF